MAVALATVVSVPAHAAECDLETPINRATPLSDNKVFPIQVGGTTSPAIDLNILLNWSDLPAVDTSPMDGAPDLANAFIVRLTQYLNAIANAGFRLPPGAELNCGYRNVITAFLYQAAPNTNAGGNALGNKIDVYFTPASARRGTIFADTAPALIHELFHLVNGQYELGTTRRNWLEEGTAGLSPDVFDATLDNVGTVNQDSCMRQLLRSPEKTLFRRDSKFGDGTNVCPNSVFWRYFTEQLGTSRTEPAYGLDALHALYEKLESGFLSWKFQPTDKIHGTGDFDGDGRHEMLVTSASHLGIFTSSQEDTRILDVRSFSTSDRESIIDRNWVLRADDKIRGIGDFNGDGIDEFLIQSRDFLGLISANRNGELSVLRGTATGPGVFRNWRPNYNDQLIAIGDFDGDGKDEALFRGASQIGMLELNAAGAFASPRATRLRELSRRLERAPRVIKVVGVGRFRAVPQEEILSQDEQGLFLWGLDNEGRFRKVHSIFYGERVGNGWVLKRGDTIHGAIDFREATAPAGAKEIVIQSNVALGILGYDAPPPGQVSPTMVSRHVVGLGRDFGNGFAFNTDTAVIGFGRLGNTNNAQIVVRNNNQFAALALNNQHRPTLVGQLDLTDENLTPAPLNTGAALNPVGTRGLFNVENKRVITSSSGQSFIIGPDNNRTGIVSVPGVARRYLLRYVPNSGLIWENRDNYGQYLRSLIRDTDEFIRARAPGRTFESMWNDLAIALYTKNLELSSLDRKYQIIDENPPGVVTDADARRSTPPVATTQIGSGVVHSEQWSKRYWHVPPETRARSIRVSYRRLMSEQRAIERTDINVEPRRVGVHLIITEANRLVSVIRDINPGFVQTASRDIALAAGQSLGVVAVNATDMVSYELDIAEQ